MRQKDGSSSGRGRSLEDAARLMRWKDGERKGCGGQRWRRAREADSGGKRESEMKTDSVIVRVLGRGEWANSEHT